MELEEVERALDIQDKIASIVSSAKHALTADDIKALIALHRRQIVAAAAELLIVQGRVSVERRPGVRDDEPFSVSDFSLNVRS